MSYQVLARKWRPKTFSELVGQEHVVRALVNGIDNDRLHHAFLFTGTRGVGKTTIARIFAKALNCETGVKSEPCGKCPTCLDIDDGRFIDLLEVDAASRTKVDDTRELLENVQYAPQRGRYKVYLIDEVHMLSNHSFNALLKTLEEPPPHVKFLLATTDPQKLPVTILSRCLQFNLKRMPPQQIAPYLAELLGHEQIEFEEEALQLIAEGADGSMRDGLSLLDQAIAHGGGALKAEQVRAMLGTVERRHTVALLEALAAGDAEALWDHVSQLSEFSPNFVNVLRDLAAALHRIAIAGSVDQQRVPLNADLKNVATKLKPADVQLFYQVAVHGRRDLDLAPDHQTGFEMTMLRMLAFRPVSDGEPVSAGGGGTQQSATGSARAEAARVAGMQAQAPEASAAPQTSTAPQASAAPQTSAAPQISAAPQASAAASVPEARAPAAEPVMAASPSPVAMPEPLAATSSSPAVRGRAESVSTPPRVPESPPSPSMDFGDEDLGWDDLIKNLGLTGAAGAVAANSLLRRKAHGAYEVVLDSQHEHMRTPSSEAKITAALQRFFGQDASVVFSVAKVGDETPALKRARVEDENAAEARRAIEADPVVQALQQDFGATIVPGSINYLN